jgi:hypothetical protein
MKKTGFTLIETLVAVTILIIGVIGPLSLAARGISDGLFAQNQLTANLLAQEAIETIVNVRNTNVMDIAAVTEAGGDVFYNIWDDGAVDSDGEIKTVSVSAMEGIVDISGCPFVTGCYLNNSVNGFYEQSNSGPFLRQITFSKPTTDELKVVVTMTWLNKTVTKKFTLSEYLYDK